MKTPTHYDLKMLFNDEQAKLEETRKEILWTNKNVYIRWLSESYEYALRSTRILALTAGHMPLNNTKYSNRFIAHAAEEKGHERLLENDVKNFGLDIREIETSPQAKAFHQSLYYWFGHGSALGIFGWILALEGFAVRNVPQMHEICLAEYGPKKTTFLKVHADEDEGHLEKAFETIQNFSEEENILVGQSLKQYCELYGQILKNCNNSEKIALNTEAA